MRGGQDQFDWEDVKADKHRESYLGHSVKAPVGRWQKGKDLHWYTKSGKIDSTTTKQQEKDAIKRMEAEALAIALGKGNAQKKAGGVTKQELAEVCRKGQIERDSMDIERVEGMGFSSSRARLMDVSSEPVKETLDATGGQVEKLPASGGRGNGETEVRGSAGEEQSREKTKKKKNKKEKKMKKEKKHKRKRHSDDDSSAKDDKRRKRRHNHDDSEKNDYCYSSRHEKKTNDQGLHERSGRKNDSKHRRHDSLSENDSSEGKRKYSRRRRDSCDAGISRTSGEKPKQRRQRHDTE